MYHPLTSRLVLTSGGTGTPEAPEYSQSVHLGQDNAAEVQVVVYFNSITVANSLIVSVQGSDDDENWGARGSTVAYAGEELGQKALKVSGVADRYVRLKFVVNPGEGQSGNSVVVAAGLHLADL